MTRSFSLLAQIAAESPAGKVEQMSAPAIRGLAATIRGATQRITDAAGKLGEALNAEAAGFEQDAADATAQLADMRAARADLRQALGLGSNGGPTTADSAQESAQSGTQFERTAIGPVTR